MICLRYTNKHSIATRITVFSNFEAILYRVQSNGRLSQTNTARERAYTHKVTKICRTKYKLHNKRAKRKQNHIGSCPFSRVAQCFSWRGRTKTTTKKKIHRENTEIKSTVRTHYTQQLVKTTMEKNSNYYCIINTRAPFTSISTVYYYCSYCCCCCCSSRRHFCSYIYIRVCMCVFLVNLILYGHIALFCFVHLNDCVCVLNPPCSCFLLLTFILLLISFQSAFVFM